jgi:SAM-dependent methyltransferase
MRAREYPAMFAVEDWLWWYVGLRREILQRLKQFAPDGRASNQALRVLDAGCGTGGLLARLAQEHRGVSVGIELVWEGLALCRSRGLPHLLQGSVNALPVTTEAFDVVFSIDVLCHAGIDELRALQECVRVLRPGGIVILQVPAFEWLRSEHDTPGETRRRYTRSEVEQLLRQADLTITQSGYRNSLLFPLVVVRRMLTRHRVHAVDARSDVKPVPRLLNAILTQVLIFESRLSQWCRLPFGLSVFCVAQKPANHPRSASS